ncbi:MAG: hypothetical protein IK065_06855 [Neisseriaceae bacterium]|nr:hypothetical protein [Neisseriaceae bacterium]
MKSNANVRNVQRDANFAKVSDYLKALPVQGISHCKPTGIVFRLSGYLKPNSSLRALP